MEKNIIKMGPLNLKGVFIMNTYFYNELEVGDYVINISDPELSNVVGVVVQRGPGISKDTYSVKVMYAGHPCSTTSGGMYLYSVHGIYHYTMLKKCTKEIAQFLHETLGYTITSNIFDYYARKDLIATTSFLYKELANDKVSYVDHYKDSKNRGRRASVTPQKVIFNPPATIVFWEDGSKTVVKCGENDIFDPEKGLAMAISKKVLGNDGHYYETFKKSLRDATMPEPPTIY